MAVSVLAMAEGGKQGECRGPIALEPGFLLPRGQATHTGPSLFLADRGSWPQTMFSEAVSLGVQVARLYINLLERIMVASFLCRWAVDP